MKQALLGMVLILGFGSQAFAAAGTLLICKEIPVVENAPKRTMILRQFGADQLTEGQSYKFEFQMFENFNARPLIAVPVTVTTEDVMVNFVSLDGKLTGIVFKDELDQTAVHFNGEDIGFDCN